ncbi:AbfB domain-containing protein [Streptomyces sp. DSM 3412]|uniref:AbfB domain-containing protein n=1 Tax=Streptomyces gottesmaniae TaxID=3075518 RepID=A0ABU2YS42_9ACTN|nr:AbfB domain-containing protein [Streptomyces sp. DSM 3412]MDT0567148.1 AbfB domain-containing protein [Streptomyces sp. DSM 3412]
MSVKLSLFSNNFPDFFVIDQNGLVDIAKIVTDVDRGNATFEWTGRLQIGEQGQLLRAVAPTGFCLRMATFDEFRIHSKFFEGITDPDVAAEVRLDSTFTLERAVIDPNHISFRSVRFPDRFIRHRDFQLFAEQVNSPEELQSACFRIESPLADE